MRPGRPPRSRRRIDEASSSLTSLRLLSSPRELGWTFPFRCGASCFSRPSPAFPSKTVCANIVQHLCLRKQNPQAAPEAVWRWEETDGQRGQPQTDGRRRRYTGARLRHLGAARRAVLQHRRRSPEDRIPPYRYRAGLRQRGRGRRRHSRLGDRARRGLRDHQGAAADGFAGRPATIGRREPRAARAGLYRPVAHPLAQPGRSPSARAWPRSATPGEEA